MQVRHGLFDEQPQVVMPLSQCLACPFHVVLLSAQVGHQVQAVEDGDGECGIDIFSPVVAELGAEAPRSRGIQLSVVAGGNAGSQRKGGKEGTPCRAQAVTCRLQVVPRHQHGGIPLTCPGKQVARLAEGQRRGVCHRGVEQQRLFQGEVHQRLQLQQGVGEQTFLPCHLTVVCHVGSPHLCRVRLAPQPHLDHGARL